MTATTPITANAVSSRLISSSGTASISASSAAESTGGIQNPETAGSFGSDAAAAAPSAPSSGSADRSNSAEQKGSDGGDSGGGNAGASIAPSNPQLNISFDGLNHFINRFGVNNGNQFSLEPPDQGLCAGNGKVFETLNDVLAVYNPNGTVAAGPISQNEFYNYPPAIFRGPGPNHNIRGPFVTDPSCLFDAATQRWFHVVLTLEVIPTSGRFTGKNHLDLAVSTSSDPAGSYTVYRVAAQDDGTDGTPNHGCTGTWYDGSANNTCLGDYPHIGADANGFYITTNEYSFFGNDFHGAQIYAFSKAALVAGGAVTVHQIDTHGLDAGNSGFTLAPASAPPGGSQESRARGTEYFLSSNAADEAHGDGVAVGPRASDQILVWALSNTSSLTGRTALSLTHTAVEVGRYTFPPASVQKAGPTPLRDCLNDPACSTFFNGAPDPFAPEPLEALDSSDSRMLQTTFVRGTLWGALDTGVGHGTTKRAGIEWFVVKPQLSHSGIVQVADSQDGYLSLPHDNVSYPAIGVTAAGRAVMAFSVMGPNHFPSAGYALMNRDQGTGQVHIAQEGAGPSDGFTGYAVEVFPNPIRPRWGDYGATAVVGNQVWIASEYIGQTCDLNTWLSTAFRCGSTRTALANWDTRISLVTP